MKDQEQKIEAMLVSTEGHGYGMFPNWHLRVLSACDVDEILKYMKILWTNKIKP